MVSGRPWGWMLYDGATGLSAGGGVASLPRSDLGALRIAAPDGRAPTSASLTLTVSSSEGGLTTSGSEVLVVSLGAVAEAPVFSGTSVFSGSDEASFAVCGSTRLKSSGTDTPEAGATLSRLPSRWTLY